MNGLSQSSVMAALQGNDPVVVGVLYTLLLLSVATWAIIIYKAVEVWRTRRAGAAYARSFWDSQDAMEFLSTQAVCHRLIPWRVLRAEGLGHCVITRRITALCRMSQAA